MSMNIPIELPVQVYMDNVGAIFMSENQTSSSRTRHMDTRWWYVNDLQSQGLIKINFVPTKENVSDIGTKNVTKEVYQEHQSKFLEDWIPNHDQQTQQEYQDALWQLSESSSITTEAGGLLRMLRYDGQTTDKVQTASNEDLIEIQVEDDVDLNVPGEKEQGRWESSVRTEQRKQEETPRWTEFEGEDPVRTESRKGKKEKEKKMGSIDCRKGRSICFCNGVDELIILK
jgi:hypothetical protein